MTNNTRNIRGFTLIETLVAILILMTAVAGPLTLAYKGFSAAQVAKDQITAFYLGQDALEFVRFARDTNRLSGTNWITGTVNVSNCIGGSGCAINSIAGTVGSGVSNLRFNPATGGYDPSGTDPMVYTRTTNIVEVVDEVELLVTTTVSWIGANGISRSVVLFETIFNWP